MLLGDRRRDVVPSGEAEEGGWWGSSLHAVAKGAATIAEDKDNEGSCYGRLGV